MRTFDTKPRETQSSASAGFVPPARAPVSPRAASQPVAESSPGRTVKVWLNAFIPKTIEGLTRPVPNRPGETMIDGPVPFVSDCFLTDQRSFDPKIDAKSRMHSEIEIDLVDGRETSHFHKCDPTEEVDCEDGSTECKKSCSTSRMQFSSVRASPSGAIEVDLGAASNNPCFSGSPDIDYFGKISVNPVARTVEFDGKVDDFPAFEMYATASGESGVGMFQKSPPKGNTPGDLFGPISRKVKARVKI